jgi:hypothetical protein
VLLLSDETLSENALKINQKQKASLPLSLQLTTIAMAGFTLKNPGAASTTKSTYNQ